MGFLMDSPFSSTHYTNLIGLGIRRNGYWEEDHHGQNSSCQRQTLWFANSNRFAYQQAGMSTSGNLDFLWMRTNICINLRWLGSRFSSRVLRLSFKEAWPFPELAYSEVSIRVSWQLQSSTGQYRHLDGLDDFWWSAFTRGHWPLTEPIHFQIGDERALDPAHDSHEWEAQ